MTREPRTPREPREPRDPNDYPDRLPDPAAVIAGKLAIDNAAEAPLPPEYDELIETGPPLPLEDNK
jgi:hypothetical protein